MITLFKNIKFLLINTLLLVICCLSLPAISNARTNLEISDWYIKDFQSEIVSNKDSSLTITEKIIADCGNLPNKHGIFRILPTQYQKTTNEAVETPIKLVSITDFNGNKLKYTTTNNHTDHTITWKIGDPKKTVIGENQYQIVYKVENAIRFGNNEFDEFYWNLNGNFWDIEIDNYQANVIFPNEVNKENVKINLYSGSFGKNTNMLASYRWTDRHSLEVFSNQPLKTRKGITLSATFPKNIFTPYKPGFFSLYWQYFLAMIPLIIFFFCYNFWLKYGKDPKINSAIAPEFEIPGNLSPLDMGVLMSNGQLYNKYLTASIINLAVKGIIKIEEIPKKSFLGKKDYKLHLVDKSKSVSSTEKILIEKIFGSKEVKSLSSLKNSFYLKIRYIKNASNDYLKKENLLESNGTPALIVMIAAGIILLYIGIYQFICTNLIAGIFFVLSCPILFLFAFLMAKRTKKGAMTYHRIMGFKMYMEKAEKYRQRFNEKENIFEKFLPYAILFGLTDKWIKAMKRIYGEKYFLSYHPVWFYGSSISAFDANSFSKSINNLSSSMSSTLSSSPSSSGSGGGGFSGGGGGGGGGGGW